jgi:GNAT superfamily N-acetyltransferase
MHRIERLNKSHNRKAFDCGGHPALNLFLQQQARQQSDKDASRTFVLVDDGNPAQIIGFFTLVLTEVAGDALPPDMAKKYTHPVGAARLARLAVDKAFQRQGMGAVLLADVMQRILALSEHAGVVGLFVDAKDAGARRYYEQYGFTSLQHNLQELFLPMGTIRKIAG